MILSLTGLILLCRDSISQWNNMGVQPAVGKSSTAESLWPHLMDGLGEIDRHFPGVKVLEVVPDTKRGLLKYRLEPEKGKDIVGDSIPANEKQGRGQIYNYNVELKTVNPAGLPVYRSELLRNLLKISRNVHVGSGIFKWLKPVWIIAMLLALLAVITGFIFHGFSCTGPLGRITAPQKSSRTFWSDVHRITGVVAGSFVFLLAFSGILVPVAVSNFTGDMKEHEEQAAEYFRQIDADYGQVPPSAVLLPSEALRRLRESYPADEYRLLSIKFPNGEKEFFSFYLTGSPYGSAGYNAVELVGMRPDGENVFAVKPSPAARLLARMTQLHRTWSMNGAVGMMWGIYLLLSLGMLVSGFYVHARRHQGQKAMRKADWSPTNADRLLLPIFSALTVCAAFLTSFIDSTGYLMAVMLFIPVGVAIYLIRKENR